MTTVPPILELFVVWHPDDAEGELVSNRLLDHFHGATFSGLVGGAVEVYLRSEPWSSENSAPRPMSFMTPWPNDLSDAQFTAVIPVLSALMAREYEDETTGWREYMDAIFGADVGGESVGVFPLHPKSAKIYGSGLANAAKRQQQLSSEASNSAVTLCREVAQAITQQVERSLGGPARIKVFVSHTKQFSPDEQDSDAVFQSVRRILRDTHLSEFFDAADIQPGDDWEKELEAEASACALLMIRTDKYSGREWTQREVKAAKLHDMPIVGLYALRAGEERGSFLMDHVPTVVCDLADRDVGIERALSLLVDESLKRTLWKRQTVFLEGFDWLPVHSPEPVTLAPWLERHMDAHPDDKHVWIMHPDPPLGAAELDVVRQMCGLAGFTDRVDVFTPRTFAAAGGELPE